MQIGPGVPREAHPEAWNVVIEVIKEFWIDVERGLARVEA